MPVSLRAADGTDIPQMAAIRAQERGTEAYWQDRIARYLSGEHNPQQALPPRAVFVALGGSELLGFVAGHQTRRFGCEGELEWINVAAPARGSGIAGQLVARIG